MGDKLVEVRGRRAKISLGGGETALQKVKQQKKLTASERMNCLFDTGTFREIGLWTRPLKTGFDIDKSEVPRDALIAGYGKVNGRTVYATCYDTTVLGGSQAAMMLGKLGLIMQQARNEGVPYVGIIDSGGRRIQDLFGRWGYRSPTRVAGCEEGALDMFSPPTASGVIPQISLILGHSVAGTAYSPVMADFVFFRKGSGYMAVASPQLLKSVTFQDVTWEQIGGAELHAATTGTCDVLVESDEEALARCRELLGYLPSNWTEMPPHGLACDAEKDVPIDVLLSRPEPYDGHLVIDAIVDKGSFFEILKLYAASLIVGFGRIAGQAIGIVASNPAVKDGSLDADACDKSARFVRCCDAFNVPLLFLVDTPGFPADRKAEQSPEGLARHAAKPVYAICESTVPKIVVYLKRCYGAGRLIMGTKEMGVDAAFAWPTAEIRLKPISALARELLGEEASKSANPNEVLNAKIRQLDTDFEEPYSSAAAFVVDDIIEPSQTRSTIIHTLERLWKKLDPGRPWKKHDLVPL
ncbi:MAG: methylmalonyl-CoA carboxyltransferase [Chloroflexi bacterium]|nr:methylmalonyl-CoA carboxyltransferase [Chloroflexota bacterium]